MNNQAIQDLQEQINKLKNEIENLSQSFFKNNFSSNQIFNKDATFNSRLQVPVYTVLPSVGQVGDLISYTDVRGAGQLYICTTAGSVTSPASFTKVGTQIA
jgi:hypothetical protein